MRAPFQVGLPSIIQAISDDLSSFTRASMARTLRPFPAQQARILHSVCAGVRSGAFDCPRSRRTVAQLFRKLSHRLGGFIDAPRSWATRRAFIAKSFVKVAMAIAESTGGHIHP